MLASGLNAAREGETAKGGRALGARLALALHDRPWPRLNGEAKATNV